MNKAIVKVTTTDTLRYADLLGDKYQRAIEAASNQPVDALMLVHIDVLLSESGQQNLLRARNIDHQSLRHIRTWLTFHPNRNTEESK